MVKSIFVCLALGLMCLCGCTDRSPTEEVTPGYLFENYVLFDSNTVFFSRIDFEEGASPIMEPVVNWEKSLGEPFTDSNSNGVYDEGIDSYQDMNSNGQYDGPDDPWEPGIPFDDIDGNGEFRTDPGERLSGYQPGMPFCDFNGNGERDNSLYCNYGAVRLVSFPWCDGSIGYKFDRIPDAVYRFESDSGRVYDISFGFVPRSEKLVLNAGGLEYYCPDGCLMVLGRGQIEEVTDEEISFAFCGREVTYHKTVQFGRELDINGQRFRDLLQVRFTGAEAMMEFYFARQHGLLAFGRGDADGDPGMCHEYFYHSMGQIQPVIMPTSR